MIQRVYEFDLEFRETGKYLIHEFDIISEWQCRHDFIINEFSFCFSFFEKKLNIFCHPFEKLRRNSHIKEFFEIFFATLIGEKIFWSNISILIILSLSEWFHIFFKIVFESIIERIIR